MSEEKKCPICGEPTYLVYGKYPRKDGLCWKHSQAFFSQEIEQCPDCGQWHDAKKKCDCKKTSKVLNEKNQKQKAKDLPPETLIENSSQTSKAIIINEENKHKCITCGMSVDGVLFCKKCYHKYKNKKLYFKISNCSSVELLDEDYEGKYVCRDGHIVKSKSEREIDNYLFNNGIAHAYEKALPYGATEKEVLHPDFFLPNYLGAKKHVYIEHWGYNENNIEYTKTKKFKLPIYEKLGITLICTNEQTDMGDIETVLDRKLNKQYIKENIINFNE